MTAPLFPYRLTELALERPSIHSFVVPKSPEGWVFTIADLPNAPLTLAAARAIADGHGIAPSLPIYYGPAASRSAEVQKASNQ